jgi:hypothetical protein
MDAVHNIPSSSSKGTQTRGWITPLVDKFSFFVLLPSRIVLGPRDMGMASLEATAKRARRVDTYVAIWFCIEIASFVIVTVWPTMLLRWLFLALVSFRVLAICATAIRAALFDRDAVPEGQAPMVASHARMVILGCVNYVELILCFATCYAMWPNNLSHATDWFDPLYFSAICQLTIGFGDLYPMGGLRGVSVLQGLIAIAVILLLVGRYIAMLRSEESRDKQQQAQPISTEMLKAGDKPNENVP